MIPRICIQMPACKAEIARVDPPACIKGGARRVSPAFRLVFSIIERARRGLVAAFAKSHSLRNLGPRTTHIRARARIKVAATFGCRESRDYYPPAKRIPILRRSTTSPHLTSPRTRESIPAARGGEGRWGSSPRTWDLSADVSFIVFSGEPRIDRERCRVVPSKSIKSRTPG